MFTTYDPSLQLKITCSDEDYLSALHLFESVCAPSIFPFVHQIDENAIGFLQQKWFTRCLQEVLALKGDCRFFSVPLANWKKMAEQTIEMEALGLYQNTRQQFAPARSSRWIA